MKKIYNKLCAIAFALLGATSLSAQTDVTSTYLTNAGFETDGHQTGTKVPTGWNVGTTSGGYTSYRPISDTATPNGSYQIGNGVTTGASEGTCYLYMRTNWGASVCEITQTTSTLPKGKYILTADVALPQTQVSRLRTLTIKTTGNTSGTTNSVVCQYNPSIWTTVSVPFEVTSEETVTISLYHNDTSGGCNAGVLSAVDNIHLFAYDYTAMASALTEAESLYDALKDGATELNDAMTTAKELTESSDKATISSAAESLITALNTYKQAQFVTPSSTDYTSYISNANLETTTGGTVFSSAANMWNSNIPANWNVSRAVNGNMNATTFGSGKSGKAFEIWATDASTVIGTFFQTINGLPAGKYSLKGHLQNSGKLFVINGAEETLYSGSPSSSGSWQEFTITFVKKSASDKLVIGAQTTAAQHFIVDDFSLECIGLDLLQLTVQRDNLVKELEDLQTTLPNAYYSGTVSPAISTANEANTEETLSSAIDNLTTILTTANTLAPRCSDLQALIELCTEYTDPQNSNPNSDDVLSALNSAIYTATTAKDAATTTEALNTAYNNLETARQTYAKNAVPVYPYPFDMTFMLPNTTFDSNIDGWTKTGGANWMSAGNVECYNTTFDFYTTYSGLNPGSWEIHVDAFYRYGGYNNAETAHNGGTEQLHAKLYANNNVVDVKSIMEGANKAGSIGAITTQGVRVPNAPADCDAYFATGYYANSISTIISDGNLKVGIKKETTQGSDWTIFDNFKLIYKGIDVTSLQEELQTLIDKATPIKEEKMGATESANLEEALNNANTSVTNADDLATMISNLTNAYNAAVSSITTYELVPTYIAKANTIDASIAEDYQTAYDNGTLEGDAETIRQELNVKTFNAASAIFTNNIEVTGWAGTMGDKNTSGQHWDGTSETKYYDNNSWNGDSHSTSTSIELPAGTYMLKAALRSHASTTMTLTVLDQVVNVKGKGDQGYGIDTSGAANFSDEGTYANEDKGRGWEWEFVKFELAETETVTLSVECNYNGVFGWASFSDITLWMDDDTYLSVNGGAIDAPLAQAKALNTLPMGNSEMSALTSAIALGEADITTANQLNEALAALETAIANANTWRTAYNEAKAPLITEMELFESDYNDNSVEWSNKCAKGQLCTTIWQAYITAIQEAAVAKDVVTDGYDFETHTTALENARTAVDASIAVYANLKAEIGYANAYTLVVESNQTDYTAAFNTAQAVWNGGTKEDPSAEILAMQNFKVLDYNYVTETYEGVATLNDWGGNSGSTNKGEHWDGTAESSYYDYSRWSGDAGNFEVTQEYNLPAGTYVLMAAGRCANVDGTDAYIKVKEEKVYFDKKGGSGLGISTDGKASFNPTGTYANTTGRGWEYRFIEFTLNSEETVTIGLGYTVADSHSPLSWAGVCAPQLRAKKLTMTDKADFDNETEEGYMVSYDREFTADTWTTVIVPFDYELPGGVTAEKLNLIAFNGPDNNWISFQEVTTLAANTPYILKNNSATAALFADLGIKTVYSTASTNNVEVEGATMKGTYKEITAAALVAQEGGDKDIIFINTKGEGRYIDNAQPADITFPAGRAYIVVDGSTFDIANNVAPRFTIFHGDDDITSIEETLNQKNEEEVIYDLAGRRIVKPTKAGIYIVNGKKMVIK